MLADWIKQHENELELDWLAKNTSPHLISYLNNKPEKRNWQYLSRNPNVIDLLKSSPQYIDWREICLNPHPDAIVLIKNHHEYYIKQWTHKKRRIPHDMMLSWENLSQNPAATEFLKEYPMNELWFVQKPPYDPREDDPDYEGNPYFDNLYPDYRQVKKEEEKNQNHLNNVANQSTDQIEENWDQIDKKQLCKNPNVIHFIERLDPEELDWQYLSANSSAIDILKKNPKKIDWRWLCKNPNAHVFMATEFENQIDKIDWRWLSANPCIYN